MDEAKTALVVTPSGVAACTNPDNSVGLVIDGLGSAVGLSPEVSLILRLSADEARRFAGVLLRKADEAEARLPQPIQHLQEPGGSKH